MALVCLGDYEYTVSMAFECYGSGSSLVYLEPPFFAKASTLYRKSFTLEDHRRLALHLVGLIEQWMLSYDHHPVIHGTYSVPSVQLPRDPSDEGKPRHRLTTRTSHYTARSRRGAGTSSSSPTLPSLPNRSIQRHEHD